MRLLIDECLSPQLVAISSQSGYEAYHVAHIGKASWTDRDVTRHAIEGDFILVTNNGGDFLRLYAKEPLHAGLVIIVPNVNRIEQTRLFRAALVRLTAVGEPVNRVLEIDVDENGIVFNFHELPREAPTTGEP